MNEDACAHGCTCNMPEQGTPAWDMAAIRRIAAMQQQIENDGYLVEYVTYGNGAQKLQRGFQYTVGLTDRHWPELVLTGCYPPIGLQLLNGLIHEATRAEQLPRAGQRFTVQMGDGPATVRLARRAPAEVADKPVGWARMYYQRKVDELAVRVQGWPCPSCTPCDRSVGRCTCAFDCRWVHCEKFVP